MPVMLKNVSFYLILLFLVSLPFDHFYSEVALIALTVHTVMLMLTVPASAPGGVEVGAAGRLVYPPGANPPRIVPFKAGN